MATRVKVKSFVASTAKYARKSARKADKNKNKKLTRTEAKALPKDLQDDFRRQAKGKSSVGVEKFASDQAAYVSTSSKRADKNKDGYLNATEAAKLPATLKDNFANYGKPAAATTTLTRDSTPIGQLALLGQLKANADGMSAYVSTWKFDPAQVADIVAHPSAHKDFLNHLLFESTGTSFERDYPTYYTPAGLSVTKLTAANAGEALATDFRDNAQDDAAKNAIDRDSKALVKSFGDGVSLMKLFWTNNDDAWFSGVFAFNSKTGKISGAGPYSEP
jgi:hypothetical protein